MEKAKSYEPLAKIFLKQLEDELVLEYLSAKKNKKQKGYWWKIICFILISQMDINNTKIIKYIYIIFSIQIS